MMKRLHKPINRWRLLLLGLGLIFFSSGAAYAQPNSGPGCTVINSYPYTQNFDGMTSTSAGLNGCVTVDDVDDCWSNDAANVNMWLVDAAGTPSLGTGPSADHTSGTGNYLYVEATQCFGNTSFVYSPEFDFTGLTTPRLSFWYHMFGGDMGTLSVETSTDGGATWSPFVFSLSGEQQTSNAEAWREATVDLPSLSGETSVFFRFSGSVPAGANPFESDMAIDDVRVAEAPSCIPPTNLSIVSVTQNDVTVSWDDLPLATNGYFYTVTLGGSGSATVSVAASGTIAAGVTSTTVTGLNPATNYDFYIASDCGGANGVSLYTSATNFSTACPAFISVFPYTQNFDGMVPNNGTLSACVTTDNITDCWSNDASNTNNWVARSVPTTSTGTGPSSDHTTGSGNFAFIETSNGGACALNDMIMYSPVFDFTSLTAPRMRFWYHMFGDDMGTLTVQYRVGAIPWDDTNFLNVTDNVDAWQEGIVDLSFLAGIPNVELRFLGVRGPNFESDMAIDDVVVEESPACPRPFPITTDYVAFDNAGFSFPAVANATSGYMWAAVVSGSGEPAGANVISSGTATSTTLIVTGLSETTDYDVYIQSDCSASGTSAWSSPVSITTPCAPISMYPYVEDMDNNVPTVCWDEAGDGDFTLGAGPSGLGASDWGGARTYVNSGGATVNSNSINLFTGNTDREWLLSPSFDLSVAGGPYQLVTEVAVTNFASTAPDPDGMTGTDDEVQLLISTDNGATWNNLTTWNAGNEPAASGTLYIEDLTTYAGQTVQFAYFASDGTIDNTPDYDFHVGVFTIETIPSCPQVIGLTNDAVTNDGGTFSWSPATGAVNYNWVAVLPGTAPTSTASASGTVSATGTTVTGLMSNTSYDFYVQADCGANGSSSWSSVLNFSTTCDVISAIPYTQNFDGMVRTHTQTSGCISVDDVDDCWSNDSGNVNMWVVNSGGTVSTGTGPSGDHTSGSGNYLYIESSTSCAPNTFFLYSPEFDLSSIGAPQMRFWYHMFGATMGSMSAEVSTDNGTTWNVTSFDLSGDQGNQWIEAIVNLSAYTGATSLIVRFTGTRGTSFTSDMAIDDFVIEEVPACSPPTGIAQVGTLTATTADFSWVASISAPANGYIWSVTTAGAGSATVSVAASGSVGAGVTSTTVTGLNPSTSYDFYIKAICGASDESAWSGPVSFATAFQAATGVTCGAGRVSGIIFSEEFDNNNAGWTGDIGSAGGDWEIPDNATSSNTGADNPHSGANYMNYEASGGTQGSIVSPPIDLTGAVDDAELSFWLHAFGADMGTLNVGIGNSATGPFTTVFTSIGEQQTSGADPWLNVGVDLSAYLGQVIYLQFTQTTGSSFRGDMSIDLLEVTACQACPAPSNVTNIAVSASTATFAWNSVGPANSYDWAVVAPGGSPTGTAVAASTTSATGTMTITGLAPATNYEFFVKATCGGDESIWIGPISFTTGFQAAVGVNCSGGATPTVVFSEEFDNNNAGWTGDVGTGNGNWEIPDDATSFNTGANNAHSGANYMNYEASSTIANQGSIVSPPIDLTGAGDAELSFWLHAFGADMGTLNVGIGNSATGTFTTVFTSVGQQQTSGADPWINIGVDLSAYLGQVIYIQFTQIDGAGFAGDMSIDLLEVTTCPRRPRTGGGVVINPPIAPRNLKATGIATDRIRLTWTDLATNETGYGIYRSDVESTNRDFSPVGSIPAGSGEMVFVDSSGLVADRRYRYYVEAIGYPLSTQSNQSEDATFPEVPTFVSTTSGCAGGEGSITVVGQSADSRFYWYTTEDSTEPIENTDGTAFEGATLEVRSNTAQTITYYVSELGVRYPSTPRLPVTVTFNANPAAVIEGAATQRSCDDEITLTAQEVTGATYTWSLNNTEVGTGRTFLGTAEGSYTVETELNGCTSISLPAIVDLNYVPTVNLTTSDRVTFCEEGTIGVANADTTFAYSWTQDGVVTGATTPNLTVTESGVYVATITDQGCVGESVPVTVTISEPFTGAFDVAIAESDLCPGERTTLTATDLGTGSYNWSRDGRFVETTETNVLETGVPGDYTVTTSFNDACNQTISSASAASLNVFDVSDAKLTVSEDDQLVLEALDGSTFASVTWFFNGEEAPQYANQTTFTPDEDGTYFASVTYATGCTTLSNAQRYFINVGGGGPLGTDDEVLELVIYPNPTDGGLILQIPSDWVGSADITLINSIGQTMLSQHIEATESLQEVRFDISGYASGAYIIQVQTAEGTFAEKVIKR